MTTKRNLSAESLEAVYNVEFPERLRRFYDDGEWKTYESRMAADLAHFESSTREKISFQDLDSLSEKFELSLDYREKFGPLFPLADLPGLEGSFFLAADLSDASVPILFFDHDGGFLPHSSSLDNFLKSLLTRKEKPRAKQLAELLAEARGLYKEEKFAEARDLIEGVRGSLLDETIKLSDQFRHLPGAARNLLGLCYQSLGEYDQALVVLEQAVEVERSRNAALNIIDIYLYKKRDYRRVLEYGASVGEQLSFEYDEYSTFYQWLYFGLAHAMLGEEDAAVAEFVRLSRRFADRDIEKTAYAVQELARIRDEGGMPREIAAKILSWFGPTTPVLDPATVAENRKWWDALPKGGLRGAFLKLMGQEPRSKKRPPDEDLARLLRSTSLALYDSKIKNLSWIARFARLRKLDLSRNQIADATPLAELRHLCELDLKKNPIKDISAIANLTRLVQLQLSETGLEDLSPLGELRELREIDASENELTSLEALRDLPELRILRVSANKITDLEPLSGSLLLKEIACYGNPIKQPEPGSGTGGSLVIKDLPVLEEAQIYGISDIGEDSRGASPGEIRLWKEARPWTVAPRDEKLNAWREWWQGLEIPVKEALQERIDTDEIEDGIPTAEGFRDLLGLRFLDLSELGMKECDALTRLVRVAFLALDGNNLTRLPDLRTLGCLRTLNLDGNRIQDFATLASAPRLAALDLEDNAIKSLQGFPVLPSLRTLNLAENQIIDIAALAAQPGLRELYLEKNRIQDIRALAALKKLRILWISQNKVADLEPLATCENLEVVECYANSGLSGLLALKDLPHLYVVRAHGAIATDEVEEFRRLRPDVDVL